MSPQLSLRLRCNVAHFSICTRLCGKSEQVLTVSVDSEHCCTHSSQSTVTMQQQTHKITNQQIQHANLQGDGKVEYLFTYRESIVFVFAVRDGVLIIRDKDLLSIIKNYVQFMVCTDFI